MESLENIYLSSVRVILLILATLAISFAAFNLINSVYKIFDDPDIETVKTPVWSQLKYQVLPIKKVETNAIDSYSKEFNDVFEIKDPNKTEIEIIVKNLKVLFSGNGVVYFAKSINIDSITKIKENIPNHELDNFLEGLIVLSEDLIEEKRLQMIEDPEMKTKMIVLSLQAYRDAFIKRLKLTKSVNLLSAKESELKKAEGSSQLLFSLFALGGFIVLLSCVLILKVEYNLRKIAPAIARQNEN